ncbi:MAG: ATP-binding cassette domain-containing protein [Candidatus Dadabacteria bacterium]|nr:ATP-binding cassette domain-containing protein [Candidatus Dadabacteria bacterium]
MSKNIIEITDVFKSFDGKPVHKGINLFVRSGEIITVLGESGVGKSVLLKEINGLVRPDSGKVMVLGENTVQMDEKQLVRIRKETGMLFQGSALFDSLTVEENIAYPLIENLDLSAVEIKKAVNQNLELVDLPGIEDKYPGELSGGMKKRVALARAIATRPKILLYDEPTTGLDPPNIKRIAKLIKSMRDRLSITGVVITHDIGTAYEISDRIAFLHGGKIVFTGTVPEARETSISTFRNFLDSKM